MGQTFSCVSNAPVHPPPPSPAFPSYGPPTPPRPKPKPQPNQIPTYQLSSPIPQYQLPIQRSTPNFGITLKTYNQQTTQHIQQATQQCMTTGGYNPSNLNLQPIPFTQNDEQHIINLQQIAAQKTTIHKSLLNFPTIPNNSNEYQINHLVTTKIFQLLQANNLYPFYNQETLQKIVNIACLHNYPLIMQNWSIPTIDMATDLAGLALYDIALIIDDSASMLTREDGMTRWAIAQQITTSISHFATLMDSNGISIDFFNSPTSVDNIDNPNTITKIFTQIQPYNGTPMGPAINRVLNRLVLGKLLTKPLNLIIITDGCPDSNSDVERAISNYYSKAPHKRAVSFSFAQVGSDILATDWLNNLDKNNAIGQIVDVTSSFISEKRQCESINPGTIFTPSRWLLKTVLGGINQIYDGMDEKNSSAAYSYRSALPPAY